ncbi:unnamed protein product, partial [Mesorhabditis belari]|uniref:lysozyme n=1 Tax=Mesorhabditis belari TaxID=2138241 RepID=A0AAF3FRF7_9BILA
MNKYVNNVLSMTNIGKKHSHYYTNKCQKSDAHKSECRDMVDRNNGSIFEIHNGYHLNLSAKIEGIFGKIRSSQFNLCFTCICHAMNLTCSWPCLTDSLRCAYFLMKEGFYVDCIREAVDINITLGISRCEKNRNCALKCVENYWMRYAENCSRDLTDFCKTVTRIVWAGPRCVAEKESLKAATEQAVANVSQCYNEGIKYDFLE